MPSFLGAPTFNSFPTTHRLGPAFIETGCRPEVKNAKMTTWQKRQVLDWDIPSLENGQAGTSGGQAVRPLRWYDRSDSEPPGQVFHYCGRRQWTP